MHMLKIKSKKKTIDLVLKYLKYLRITSATIGFLWRAIECEFHYFCKLSSSLLRFIKRPTPFMNLVWYRIYRLLERPPQFLYLVTADRDPFCSYNTRNNNHLCICWQPLEIQAIAMSRSTATICAFWYDHSRFIV